MNDAKIRPRQIRVEASSFCQLRCPSCPTGTGELRTSHIGSGLLAPADFERLLAQAPYVRAVELSNWGEVFLNKRLPDLLKIAFERGVQISLSNGVNLNTVSERALRAVVQYGVRHITVSIDGASQSTYVQYRVGGNFEQVIENVKTINRLKREARSEFPRLSWQFVVFGHNEHELPVARAMAEELGMTFVAKLSWDESFSPVRNKAFVIEAGGLAAASRSDYLAQTNQSYARGLCLQLWQKPQIDFDGKVLGCCINTWGDFGNVFDDGFLEVLNGDRMRRAREMLQGRRSPDADIPCTTCSKFRMLQQSGEWIKDDEL